MAKLEYKALFESLKDLDDDEFLKLIDRVLSFKQMIEYNTISNIYDRDIDKRENELIDLSKDVLDHLLLDGTDEDQYYEYKLIKKCYNIINMYKDIK